MILYGPRGEEIHIVEYRESAGYVPILIEIEDQEHDSADCVGRRWVVDLEEDEGELQLLCRVASVC